MAPAHSRHLFSYENFVHAVSGAAGSVAAMSTFYPLDNVRSVLQVDEKRVSKNTFAMLQDLMREEGILSLYRGLLPVLISVCASNFLYFYTFHGLKALKAFSGKKQSALRDLFLASLAGVVNVLVTTPLWVVNTRLKLQGVKFRTEDIKDVTAPQYEGMIDGLIKIRKQEGLKGLWSSTLPSLMLVINPGIQFMVYESLKRRMQKSGSQNLSAMTYFCVGAIAKAVATCITYPLQLVQSKFRFHGKKPEATKNLGVIEMVVYILRTQGVKGLYKGLEAKLLQTVLTAALMFLFYEKIAAFVFHIMKKSTMPVKT